MTPDQFALVERVVTILKSARYITPEIAYHRDREMAELRLDLHEAREEIRSSGRRT
jgi:hypothetical protein